MKKTMSDLPRDLAEEVLSRVPVTSMRRIRSACKMWHSLSRDESFAKKHLGRAKLAGSKGITVATMIDYRVSLMRFDLSANNNAESCIKPQGKLIGPNNSDRIDVCQIFHYEGLLLCVMKDHTRLVVWNPYLQQTRWILATHNFHKLDSYLYALGYDKSSKSHKVLRFIDEFDPDFVEFKIYDFSSDSWKVLDLPQEDWRIEHCDHGLTLKGNTLVCFDESFLVCFDFEREIFGPRLPVPFEWFPEDTVSLCSVREEQLAILFQTCDTLIMEVWVTTKIEVNTVLWNSKVFISADIKQLIHPQFHFPAALSFLIDEEKKAVVVFDENKDLARPYRHVAYIIRVDGSLREVDFGKAKYPLCVPMLCLYVPSLVQLG